MKKEVFFELFQNKLEEAIVKAEEAIGVAISRQLLISLYGAGYSGFLTDVRTASDIIFLDENMFYQVIDIAVIEVQKDSTKIFARVSGHSPSTFDKTWNTPPGNGPFKLLEPVTIKVAME